MLIQDMHVPGSPSERRYRMLQIWAKEGVFLVEPKDNGRPSVVTVTELASLTVDEGKRCPDKVEQQLRTLSTSSSKWHLRSGRQCR